MLNRCSCLFAALTLVSFAGTVSAEDAVILWPAGWDVQTLPVAEAAADQPSVQWRQRAVRQDPTGEPSMVVELTRSRLVAGHEVNVQGVLLEMRKAVQVNFARGGLQSACTHAREVTLGGVPAVESTCTVTQNGVHVMSQTLVAAASKEQAWSLSYAGTAEGYAAHKDEVQGIREALRFTQKP